jgi:glycosyltransferase involved in cell wall biosynthesis
LYRNHRLGIVVPAYNEAEIIAETLAGMPDIADRIYVVDDASQDATRQIAENFNDRRICVLGNGRNLGVGAAIVTGYRKALEEGMDIAVVMAGDNQMSAAYLTGLLDPIISEKVDYTKGNRLSRSGYTRGMSLWRLCGNRLLSFLTRIASGYREIGDPQNGYTAVSRDCLLSIDLDGVYPRYGYCNDLLIKLNVAGCRVRDVPIPARYGREKSKIKYRKYITTVSPLLLRGFLWRLRTKYLNGFVRRYHVSRPSKYTRSA